jgi:tungstate transport system ATP-binding protein
VTSQAAYALEQVTQSYGDAVVLDVPALRIQRAAITGLIGANGSGKSTLLELLGFIRRPASGVIRFFGRPAGPFDPAVRTAGVTLLNQDVYLLKRSVISNVAYGLKIRGQRRDAQRRIAAALGDVGLPIDTFGRRPWFALSGGEAQRVALAARLVLRPRVLLLDEPTASVDDHSARLIKRAALQARERWGTTLVIASHDVHWLHTICDDIIYLHAGRVMASGFVTAIDGPWQPDGDRYWVHELADGQRIRANGRPSGRNHRAAIVEAGALELFPAPPGPDPASNLLSGILTRVIYEKRTGGFLASVEVGPLSFTCRLPRERAEDFTIQPGRTVFIRFPVDAVSWQPANS